MYPYPSQSHPPYPQHQDSYPHQHHHQQQQQQPQPPPPPASSSSHQPRDRDQPRDPPHPSSPPIQTRAIGAPLNFATGQFTGKHVRAELIELQKADLGRKYARKDRRPLDPPPVVQLKLYFTHPGTDRADSEVENYDDINNMGLICHVDLFPVPSSDVPDLAPSAPDDKRRAGSPSRASTSTLSPAAYSPGTAPTQQPYAYTYPAPQPPYGAPSAPAPAPVPPVPVPPPQQQQQQQQQQPDAGGYGGGNGSSGVPAPPSNPSRPDEIVHYFRGAVPIAENSKQTDALAGTTFVQAANLDYKGNKVLMFVFSDLAVKAEGTFILRYRCFDLFSRVHASDGQTPVWAECYGGAFRVYSTKEFPGLRASTDLTKHLSYFGVRLNLRETERKRRKKLDDPMQASGAGSSRARRRDDEGSGGYDD